MINMNAIANSGDNKNWMSCLPKFFKSFIVVKFFVFLDNTLL